MASNSLMQSCVFGHRAAVAIAAQLAQDRPAGTLDPTPPVLEGTEPEDLAGVRADLRVAMSAGAGPIRTADGLDAAAKALDAASAILGPTPAPTRDSIEVHSMVTAGRLFVRSARLREESRGTHWREDFPGHDPRWGGMRLRVQPGESG